eukprot:TRINITY_DN8215_c0_g1_i2.p1 TRINITY_DN8215_c0_g1~~TRINITY_DN8215_c0_g1_i2.p1  ORF type:complete len:359 (-),score=113.70 TRINITY_DN8215_c0_g1_i2:248-1324(-)
MKSLFSKKSQRVNLALTVHFADTLPPPVPETAMVLILRNGKPVGDTTLRECNGKGLCTWNERSELEVTMYTDGDNKLKSKTLGLKIRDRRGATLCKQVLDVTPFISTDGSPMKFRVPFDPINTKYTKDKVGLTLSITPTWHDGTVKHDQPMSEMTETMSEMSEGSQMFLDEVDEPDIHVDMRPSRARANSAVGLKGESITGGIAMNRTRSSEAVELESLVRREQALRAQVHAAEGKARTAREAVERETARLQQSSGFAHKQVDQKQLARLREENLDLQSQIEELVDALDSTVSKKPNGKQHSSQRQNARWSRPRAKQSDQASKEYVSSLEMDLVLAKTELAEWSFKVGEAKLGRFNSN